MTPHGFVNGLPGAFEAPGADPEELLEEAGRV